MLEIREKYADDKMKQQQAMMELYKTEKINPLAGCWPILIQIPVFFALYKVLYVTIEMRHAPFFGWIQDLAAPDPTSIFNLFGLLPFAVPAFLMIGVWPLIMGVTMFIQMRMNPTPPDPTQAMIFNYMPVIFTFMLAIVPGRSRDLLGVEQHALDPAAGRDHEAPGRQDRAVGQSDRPVQEETFARRIAGNASPKQKRARQPRALFLLGRCGNQPCAIITWRTAV
jgi:YidC/Oxa1 family membrane protein insertase